MNPYFPSFNNELRACHFMAKLSVSAMIITQCGAIVSSFRVLLVSAFFVSLHSQSYADKARDIIGKWETMEIKSYVGPVSATAKVKSGSITEYRKDGTFTDPVRTGAYQILNDKTLHLTYTERDKQVTKDCELRLSDSTMVQITRSPGYVAGKSGESLEVRLRRVK